MMSAGAVLLVVLSSLIAFDLVDGVIQKAKLPGIGPFIVYFSLTVIAAAGLIAILLSME